MQRLQGARQSLSLAPEIQKRDKYDLLIFDDISYVRKDQAETSGLFELMAARYERKSIMITANQPFSGRDDVFPDKAIGDIENETKHPNREEDTATPKDQIKP